MALLVLSIGLLAVAGMQLKALQGAHVAYQRSLASVIAIDAQERLWAKLNPGAEPGAQCPGVGEVSAAWKAAWFRDGGDGRDTLAEDDDGGSEITRDADCSYRIVVDWVDARLGDEEETDGEGGDSSVFVYRLELPGNTS